ncbi:uncharacterized protein LOC128883958 isoform X2 [Hylaeus volcanicus]|uniref:uncharacterized protein LOC128883958 isoform X2 n=1 Tax=Hylaeus volcanicus TaxID=313075 RepID=UPI0023B7FABF|nr:uncharacterized protein LOC128883958 isoform X2 [Hylaeus volcanicus]
MISSSISHYRHVIQFFMFVKDTNIYYIFLCPIFLFTTSITLFCFLFILTKESRRTLILLLRSIFWILASTFFLSLKSVLVLYHFSRILFDLMLFFLMKLFSRFVICLQYATNKSLKERKARKLLRQMEKATTYSQWIKLAEVYDVMHEKMHWRENPVSSLYEWKRVQEHTEKLREARLNQNIETLMVLLRLCCYRDFCGISNKKLYTKALSGTKILIHRFTQEITASLEYLCSAFLIQKIPLCLQQPSVLGELAQGSVKISNPRPMQPSLRLFTVCDTSTQTETFNGSHIYNHQTGKKIRQQSDESFLNQTTSNKDESNKRVINEINRQSCCENQADGNFFHHLLRIFTSIRLSLGNTAMCLSGGGSLAMYHMGVVKALISLNCLPNVISGTSGGSIVAGVMAIFHNDELVNDILKPDIVSRYGSRWFPSISQQVKQFVFQGHMIEQEQFVKTCKKYFSHWTFLEAYQRTGRCVSIVVTPSCCSPGEALVLNFITAPDVFIWSAVAASCALPGLLPPSELVSKGFHGDAKTLYSTGIKWIDGSLNQDIPIKELGTMFNVKQVIVSQVNPHHTPFVENYSRHLKWMKILENWIVFDIKNRYSKLAKFNMLPKIFGKKFTSFWMVQEFEGHVTITPEQSFIDWYRIILQPSEDDMKDYITKGQARTWFHAPRIQQMLKNRLLMNALKK